MQQVLKEYVAYHPGASPKEAAQELGLKASSVSKALWRLARRGEVYAVDGAYYKYSYYLWSHKTTSRQYIVRHWTYLAILGAIGGYILGRWVV
jgi:DNA-binding MarR family transcriptional regulator